MVVSLFWMFGLSLELGLSDLCVDLFQKTEGLEWISISFVELVLKLDPMQT